MPDRARREDARNRGTLVNALLFHFAKLSDVGGELRPGIVHRLDKQTSGIIVVAKDDSTHRKLGEMFSQRQVAKTYIALVHGNVAKDETTVNLPIARDLVRRTRMTTRRRGRTRRRSRTSRSLSASSQTMALSPWSRCASRPAGRTRFASTCSRSGIPSSATPSTARRTASATRRPGYRWTGTFSMRRIWPLPIRKPRRQWTFEAPLPAELEAFLAAIRAGFRGVE